MKYESLFTTRTISQRRKNIRIRRPLNIPLLKWTTRYDCQRHTETELMEWNYTNWKLEKRFHVWNGVYTFVCNNFEKEKKKPKQKLTTENSTFWNQTTIRYVHTHTWNYARAHHAHILILCLLYYVFALCMVYYTHSKHIHCMPLALSSASLIASSLSHTHSHMLWEYSM